MHTRTVLQKFFQCPLPSIHTRRLQSLQAAVDAVMNGASVSVTGMGRHLRSAARIKHNVKRVDRLIGNQHLHNERKLL